MMIAALVALGLAAIAGIYLASRHFLRRRLPASVALLHGLGGATGFTLVLLTVVREPTFRPIRDVLYLLVATVLLGVVNLLFHVRRVRHRTSLIILHGLTAVTSAAMLIRAIVVYAPLADTASAHVQPSAALSAAARAAPPRAAEPAASPTAAPAEPRAPEDQPDAAAATGAAPRVAAEGGPSAAAAHDELAVERLRQALQRTISFETASASVGQSLLSDIAAIANLMKDHPEIGLVEVQGHADERGDESENARLTRARATAVVNALAAQGVERKRLRSAGYGARCPADPACRGSDTEESCHTASAWQRDRRVVFVALKIGETTLGTEGACVPAPRD